jgi:hypothetical protein
MSQIHVQDTVTAGSIESSLREAATASMVADADFATDQATILANIATRNAKIVSGQRPDLYGEYLRLVATIKLAWNLLGSATMTAGSLATIYAAIDQTWQPGFGVSM